MSAPDTTPDLRLHAGADLPQHLVDHLPIAQEAATRNLQRVHAAHGREVLDLQRQAMEVLTPRVPPKNRIVRLRHIAAQASAAVTPYTACASGCSHCCHLSVSVPRSEARLIAKATGRALAEPSHLYNLDNPQQRDYLGTPCTLLVNGKCAIYAHRPLACRTMVNMDSSDLLCQIKPGVEVPVAYLDTRLLKAAFVSVTSDEDYADVREWFPA